MAIQHVYTVRTCLYGYRQIRQVCTYEFLQFVFMPCIHFGKAEVAYRHRRLASYASTWYSCTLQSYIHIIVPSISPCCYLQVQVTYLNELYRECSGTACACMNNGYQVFLYDFCQVPGNEVIGRCNLWSQFWLKKTFNKHKCIIQEVMVMVSVCILN